MHLRRRTYGILTEMCKYILESLVDFGTKLETGEPVLIKKNIGVKAGLRNKPHAKRSTAMRSAFI